MLMVLALVLQLMRYRRYTYFKAGPRPGPAVHLMFS